MKVAVLCVLGFAQVRATGDNFLAVKVSYWIPVN
jgi:hypothetical protein